MIKKTNLGLGVMMACIMLLCISVSTAYGQATIGGKGEDQGRVIVGGSGGGNQTTGTLQNPLKVKSVGEAVEALIEIVTYVAVFFAVLALVWVGFKFIAARGDSKKHKDAAMWLTYIVIGLAIILGARLIISLVLGTLEATGTVNPNIINSARNAVQGK